MIVVVSQSHIHQNFKFIAVDACPSNSSIGLVKSYPNSMCVCVWARTCPNCFVSVVSIHPDPMVAITGWGWHPSIFYGGCCFSISTLNNIGQLPLFAWVNTHPNVLFDVSD